MKSNPNLAALRRNLNKGDKLPEDSLNLPASLEKLFQQLGNLSKEEALEAIDKVTKILVITSY